jgi:hypothetical protein
VDQNDRGSALVTYWLRAHRRLLDRVVGTTKMLRRGGTPDKTVGGAIYAAAGAGAGADADTEPRSWS